MHQRQMSESPMSWHQSDREKRWLGWNSGKAHSATTGEGDIPRYNRSDFRAVPRQLRLPGNADFVSESPMRNPDEHASGGFPGIPGTSGNWIRGVVPPSRGPSMKVSRLKLLDSPDDAQ